MFQWLSNISRKGNKDTGSSSILSNWEQESEGLVISSHLEINRKVLMNVFEYSDDLVVRDLTMGRQSPTRAFIAFIEPLINGDLLQRALMNDLESISHISHPQVSISWLKDAVLTTGKVEETNLWKDVAEEITRGFVALFVEGQDNALLVHYLADIKRAISNPVNETVTRGPLDAFIEDISANTALIRKRLPTPRLAVKQFSIGKYTKNRLNLVYMRGLVMPGLIEEVTKRIERIEVDGITGGGQLEELLQDNPYSPFSGIDTTERPDRLVAALLEGRGALIFDNTPYSLLFPSTLTSQMQSPEDYYNRFWFASFVRILRWAALLWAVVGPSFYIAVTSFHQELIPTALLSTIATTREAVPFPAFLEALLMELTFEILREAGIRLPKPFGQTIGIVGAVVIGSAAVSAGLVSSPMVVIVAMTAIASYTIPSLTLGNNIRVLRFPLMILAAFLGLFGIMAGVVFFTFHLCSLRTFGIPFLSPLAPLSIEDMKDTFIRVPNWKMVLRPKLIGYANPHRKPNNLKPQPSTTQSSKELKHKGRS